MQAEWIWGLAGGLMIGTATWLLFAGIGRIAGISGILFHAVQSAAPQNRWRWVFLAALLSGPWLLAAVGDGLPRYDAGGLGGAPLRVIAGLMVGLGTRLGNGCTSGHGVCGVARLSPRSLAATATFMLVGVVAASALRPWLLGTGAHP